MNWKKSPIAVLGVLMLIHELAQVDRNILLGFSPQIMKELSIGMVQYAFLTGAVWVVSFGFMALFMGTMADRFSRPRVIAVGILIWSICTWASGFAQNFGQMAAARFLVASGEAALGPAAVSILVDLFSSRRRSTVIGIFYMGIPIGIGVSFLLAGTFGETHGWRATFNTLGVLGIVIAVSLAFMRETRQTSVMQERPAPLLEHAKTLLSIIRNTPVLTLTVVGFVLIDLTFVSLAFTQLWLVTERGLGAAETARRIGMLHIVAGMLGALVGGFLGDNFAIKFKGAHAGFISLMVCICAPLMMAYRFAPVGSPLFYAGMFAGFFIPLAVHGPVFTIIQGSVPAQVRATVLGFALMSVNIFSFAIGGLIAGVAKDKLTAAGVAMPFTKVLFATDILVALAAVCFVLVARKRRTSPSFAAEGHAI